MLENSMFESGGRAKTRKPATVLASIVFHGIIIAVLVVVPLFQTQVAPIFLLAEGLLLPPMPQPLKPEVELVPPLRPNIQTEVRPTPGDLIAPPTIPPDIAIVVDPPNTGTIAGLNSERSIAPLSRGPIFSQGHLIETPLPPPPPPSAPPVAYTAPIRLSNHEIGSLIHQVKPVYPELARRVRAQGVVILEAIISRDGSVTNLRVISGHPLLIDAARDAVLQWRYKPTMLNGEAIEVITTITVNFTLQ